MYDQEKKKSRGNLILMQVERWFHNYSFYFKGFGFLSFEDEEAVDRCVSEHFVNLNGKQVRVFIIVVVSPLFCHIY